MSAINPHLPTPAALPNQAHEPLKQQSATAQASGSDGSYTVTGKDGKPVQIDLATIAMMLAFRRTENLDRQITIQGDETKDLNKRISDLTFLLTESRKCKSTGCGCDHEVTFDNQTRKIRDWLKDFFGLEVMTVGSTSNPVEGEWSGRWDVTIHNIQTRLDDLGTDAQEANNRIENLTKKRENCFNAASKFIDTDRQGMKSSFDRI